MGEKTNEQLIANYCDAYKAANGYRPNKVRYERGWFRLPISQAARRTQIIEYTERLWERSKRERDNAA